MNKCIVLLALIPSISLASFDPIHHRPSIASSRARIHSRSVDSSPLVHPRILSIRQEEKHQENNYNIHAPIPVRISPLLLAAERHDASLNMQHLSPEVVHVAEIKAHASEVKSISRKKVACYVAASAIISSILTSTVILTIHFTECSK